MLPAPVAFRALPGQGPKAQSTGNLEAKTRAAAASAAKTAGDMEPHGSDRQTQTTTDGGRIEKRSTHLRHPPLTFGPRWALGLTRPTRPVLQTSKHTHCLLPFPSLKWSLETAFVLVGIH